MTPTPIGMTTATNGNTAQYLNTISKTNAVQSTTPPTAMPAYGLQHREKHISPLSPQGSYRNSAKRKQQQGISSLTILWLATLASKNNDVIGAKTTNREERRRATSTAASAMFDTALNYTPKGKCRQQSRAVNILLTEAEPIPESEEQLIVPRIYTVDKGQLNYSV
ncbi:unnamed protein product [Strongylus vulgaris]|uniref:Uncharacterized protein n=1 Tax=Strongylus vulgaris TaxID=40348 RepID=A0A3P7JEN9_STRVU|nr:unnamed protein product [Strongylus vulgaris]